MKYFYLILLLIVIEPVFGQTSKYYVTRGGDHTNNPNLGIYYLVIQKLQDSVYNCKQYNTQNQMLMEGYYKDSTMDTANGLFTFYVHPNAFISGTDTSTYVKMAGSYVNGRKNGLWTAYIAKNTLNYTCNFLNDSLNGTYREYFYGHGKGIKYSGNYIDNKKDGEWDTYDTLKNITVTTIYDHGTLVSETYHSRGIVAPDNFYATIDTSLKDVIKKFRSWGLEITFAVDTDGTLRDFQADQPIASSKMKQITNAILAAGKFKPAIYNDKPYVDTYTWKIAERPNIYPVVGNSMMNGYSKHPDLIGRGLNNMGIGKPIKDDN